MDINKILEKRISRKDFMKYMGFFILAILLYPKKALNFMNEEESFKKEIKIDGIKVMEIVDK